MDGTGWYTQKKGNQYLKQYLIVIFMNQIKLFI